jgi:hypothetical protein
MELRYMGFLQTQNTRVYQFDRAGAGKATLRLKISVDMVLFLRHRVGIQEGPALCAQKLNADLESLQEGEHELTNDDLLAYTAGRAAAEARKAESRKPGPTRRKPDPGQSVSTWGR